MMVRRPEGLFPVETAKAEMHGIGIVGRASPAARPTSWPLAEEEVIEAELDEPTPMPAAFAADTPPDAIRERDLPEDTR